MWLPPRLAALVGAVAELRGLQQRAAQAAASLRAAQGEVDDVQGADRVTGRFIGFAVVGIRSCEADMGRAAVLGQGRVKFFQCFGT